MDETTCCDDVPANVVKYIANEDCTGGYMCYNGPKQFIECPAYGDLQLLFDESASSCNWPQSVGTCKSSCPSAPAPVPATPAPTATPTCPTGTDNMGNALSASDFDGVFSTLNEPFNYLDPLGRESQVALLVGGSYDGPLAAEIEGRIVVLGDFHIGHHGLSSLGTYLHRYTLITYLAPRQ